MSLIVIWFYLEYYFLELGSHQIKKKKYTHTYIRTALYKNFWNFTKFDLLQVWFYTEVKRNLILGIENVECDLLQELPNNSSVTKKFSVPGSQSSTQFNFVPNALGTNLLFSLTFTFQKLFYFAPVVLNYEKGDTKYFCYFPVLLTFCSLFQIYLLGNCSWM